MPKLEKSYKAQHPRGKMRDFVPKDKQLKARIDRIQKMVKVYVEAKMLFRQRTALLKHARRARWALHEELLKELEYVTTHYNLTTFNILSHVGMEYQNIFYPIIRKIKARKEKENARPITHYDRVVEHDALGTLRNVDGKKIR